MTARTAFPAEEEEEEEDRDEVLKEEEKEEEEEEEERGVCIVRGEGAMATLPPCFWFGVRNITIPTHRPCF
jgi:hypothetical protein